MSTIFPNTYEETFGHENSEGVSFLFLMSPLHWAQVTWRRKMCVTKTEDSANLGREQIKELKGHIASRGWECFSRKPMPGW